VEAWQVILFVFFAVLPFALLADFWPRQERLDFRGRPIPREWRPGTSSTPVDDGNDH
jgi:hypothetical protein